MAAENKKTEPIERMASLSIDAGKAVSFKDGEGKHLREGEKPSAPANFTLPKPVAIPPASAANGNKGQEKK
jgi:hypothetical protein